MALKLSNNAVSTLAASITAAATTLTVQSGDAGKFPSMSAGDWCPATIIDSANNMEIVRITARSGATLTVVRAQEGTTAKAFAAGSRIDIRLTAGAINYMAGQSFDNITVTGGTISGIIDLAVADGGTGASTPEGARANLGLAAVASSGAAEDLTGTLADARLPGTMSGKTFTTAAAFNQSLSVGAGTGGALEIGRVDGTAASAVIDFHTSATAVDYNARLVASGNVGLGLGTLDVISSTFTHNGQDIWDAGNLAPVSQAEAQSGTSTTARAWSPLRVAQAALAQVVANSPKVLSTETTLTVGTTQQNTSGKPIFASLTRTFQFVGSGGTVTTQISTGGSAGSLSLKAETIISRESSGATIAASVSYTIPDGAYYLLQASNSGTGNVIRTLASAVN